MVQDVFATAIMFSNKNFYHRRGWLCEGQLLKIEFDGFYLQVSMSLEAFR